MKFPKATVTAAGRGLICPLGTVATKQEISRDRNNSHILMLSFCLSPKFFDNPHDDTTEARIVIHMVRFLSTLTDFTPLYSIFRKIRYGQIF
jgi:hypothetical protein